MRDMGRRWRVSGQLEGYSKTFLQGGGGREGEGREGKREKFT